MIKETVLRDIIRVIPEHMPEYPISNLEFQELYLWIIHNRPEWLVF